MKVHIIVKYLILVSLSYIFTRCQETEPQGVSYTIDGIVQKGPFLSQSEITLYGLSSDFQSKKSEHKITINDNNGYYSFQSVSLNSSIVLVEVHGNYYNEVTGKPSIGPLTLSALGFLPLTETIHVNLFTHLEKRRLQTLIQQGNQYEKIYEKVQKELIDVFGFSTNETSNSNTLNILQTGELNEMLLAMSIVVQGQRDSEQLMELLTQFENDFYLDGRLSSDSIMFKLCKQAHLINLDDVKENLSKYEYNLSASKFEDYFKQFISHIPFPELYNIELDEVTLIGLNLLTIEDGRKLLAQTSYCLSVGLSESSEVKDVTISIVKSSGNGTIIVKESQNIGSNWEFANDGQTFQATLFNKTRLANMQIIFEGNGAALMTIIYKMSNQDDKIEKVNFTW